MNDATTKNHSGQIFRYQRANSICKEYNVVDLIRKKRDGLALTKEELRYFISGTVNNTITEVQIGAMLMAICLRDMTDLETRYLTEAMIDSGERLSFPASWSGQVVSKHSTGGVGDKVSLVLVPALAAMGLKVPKISGRGLGHTGGTLDKLESIPGFQVTCSSAQVCEYVEKAGCCLVAQTDTLVPADKVLYAIRDTTATVESIPLIAGSIMSKKAVESIDALVLELTFGRAAPMKTENQARKLAKTMIETSIPMGLKTTAVLTKMHHPMGKMIGNSLEIIEAIQCLNGDGPSDITEMVDVLGGYLLYHVNKAESPEAGATIIHETLQDGSARRHFQAMIEAQGVPHNVAATVVQGGNKAYSVLPKALYTTDLVAEETGYVSNIEAFTLADVLRRLGASRETPTDDINLAVGLELSVQIGDHISEGSTWITVHHDFSLDKDMKREIQTSLGISPSAPLKEELTKIVDIVS